MSEWVMPQGVTHFLLTLTNHLIMSRVVKVNAIELARCIQTCWWNGLVPMIHGEPGIGKSNILWSLAKRLNFKVIDIRLSQSDPVDLNGCISVTNGRGSYAPMDIFPLEGEPLPEILDANGKGTGKFYAGWIIFFDEINSAPAATQAAAYKPVLDRMIGQKKLHPMAFIAAAGNLMTDGAIVTRTGTAMQSRLIHFQLGVDHHPWAAHAGKMGWSNRIIGYINANPTMLHKFDPMHDDKTFPCPRTWEFASRIVTKNNFPELNLPLLAGTVGVSAAISYTTYEEIYKDLATFSDVLQAPDTIIIPKEPAALAALATMVGSNMTLANAKSLMKWVHRVGIEFQAFCMRDAINRTPTLMSTMEIDSWATKNAKILA